MTTAAWRLSVGTLLGLCLFWYVGRPPLGDAALPDWLLPCCMALGWAAPPPRRFLADAPGGRTGRWLAAGTMLLLVALIVVVAWGALATPSRHWDGAATWDARARVLATTPTLAQPYFADPAVYCHSRDYPLLQPFAVAMLERATGQGRLFFPLLFTALIALVFTGSRRKDTPAWLPWTMALGCALTPMLVNPVSGGADSGYAELLLLTCTTAMTVGIARQWPLVLALGAMLAIASKPEGLVYAPLAVLVAFAQLPQRMLAGGVVGTMVGVLGWLPVRAQLHPGVQTTDATGWAVLGLAATVLVADVLLRRTRAGTRIRWLLAAGGAAVAVGALLLHPAAAGADTALGRYLAEPERLLHNAAQLPAIAGSFVEQGVLKLQFGATFVLPPVLWLLLRRRLPAGFRAASAFVLLGLAAILLPFLLSPEPDLQHHLRSSMARLQLHWLGGAWLLSALLLPELLAQRTAPASASGNGALRWLVPPGSRRDRCAWMAWLAIRKLKEGPGPWLRAARLCVFQLLPAGAQELLLRARGHRRQARALPPSAGPEVKGLVVVVLPVYQQAQLLGAAIESVLAQTWQALELIVLDDGSGPEVAAVLARYAGEGRVRILHQDNRGLPQALDAAFELAQGEYWCWTSADNLMRPRMLEELVGFLRARPEVAMVYADYELIDGNGAPLQGTDFRVASRAGPDDARVRLPRGTAALAVVPDNFIGPCFCYRGTVGRLLSGYSPEMGIEDYDYWLRVDGAFRIEHLGRDTALYRYRVHDDSLSARASELGIRQRLAGLMARQRRRAEWFATPLQFVAGGDWLRPLLEPGEALVSGIPHGRKTLVVADAAALHREPLPFLPASAAAAVWFDSVAEVYAGHRALAGEVAAFTADPAVAARLAVFTRTVFLGDRDAATLATARAFANDRTFQRCEWPQQRNRPAPAPCCQRALRVLLLADGFAQGGMEQVIADLAVGLAGRGAAVSVLALRPAPGAMAWLQQRGIDVVDPDAGRDGTAFRSLLQQERFDVVSAHDCTTGADAAAAAAVPFVQTIHGAYVWLPPERRARYRTADAHTTAYVAVSAAALEYADVQLELDVGKAVIVHNGIDLERWQDRGPRTDVHRRTEWGLAASDFVFLQVGTLSPPKGQLIAIRALAAMRDQEPRAKLVCLGRENDLHYTRLLRAEAERLGVAEAVVFAGFHADPAPFHRLADALVLPSFYEGCSVAALEALAQGLPLVLSDVGAAAEQLALGSGCLVRPPFASVTELDWANLQRLLGREHPEYTARLAAAMLQVMQLPRRPLSAPQRWAIDRRRMADAYLRLFGWLRQGGAPAAARAWLRRPAPAPSPQPAAMTPSLSR